MNYTQIEHDACGIGAIVNIDGHQDHQVVDDALSIVEKLEHRAGKDAAGEVGDGVGILLQISHDFFKNQLGEDLNERDYGVGMFFFPDDALKRTFAMRLFEIITKKNGLSFLKWREVPVNQSILGQKAYDCMPHIMQCFIKRPEHINQGIDFDRRLFVVRREFEQSSEDTYICSLSSRTIVYKGMFLVHQLREFYDDLNSPLYQSAIAIVHSRFSTNTVPSWQRAHPYRMIAHNGEINTIRGNIDRMLAREETIGNQVLEDDLDKILPVINNAGSDSAMLDNTLEFLYMSGMDLPLAMMILIPEPWKHNTYMTSEKTDFYHYYATMMEPWDGPAAILFSDGDLVGATLDRNGLRPSRYYLTDDNRLILSSEVGVLDIDARHIIKKSRLQPGRMLLVDTKQKRVIDDDECKSSYASSQPYGEWLDLNLLHLGHLSIPNKQIPLHTQDERDRLYKVFDYTYEDVKDTILPMAKDGKEPIESMGHDIPLAVLSRKHQPLFYYFKQLFAQVTNPPIDSLREKIVTDTTVYIGSDGNLLQEKSQNCRVLEVENPILTGLDLMKIESLDQPGFKVKKISLLYYKHTSLKKALKALNIAIDKAYNKGFNILILSDKGVDENHVAIPSLLAVSSVEQHLVQTKKRTAVSLILESGEPRDVHQFATLLSFGARAVYPYLAHECIHEIIKIGMLDKDEHTAIDDYNRAILDGIVKIMAKMGISTLQSYESAHIFEAVGLSSEFVNEYFTGIVTRAGGVGLEEISEDVTERHDHAFDPLGLGVDTTLDSLGYHRMRSGDNQESHMYDPMTLILLQKAVRSGNYETFKEYTRRVDDDQRPHTLRGMMSLVSDREPLDISEVEPVDNIVKRFKAGAMSYGSISQEAHETIAKAMNSLHAKSNTGEGGEPEERYGTDRNSAIKQVASGRFGVTSEYLNSAKEIQIKMAQGAKPGEGGHLPGTKVYPWIAKMRYSTPGVSLISPPPHHDIYSIEDLAQLIYDLKNANRDARISVKLVSENGVGTIASGVAKAGAQVILISGYDGGTGAAPASSIHHAGLPWELGVVEAHHALIENGLRERVVIETDGKLMSGRDVVIAALLGAEEYGFATSILVSMGCMMMRVCNKNTCPFGIATQNMALRERFKGKSEHVVNLMRFIAQDMREIMAELGFRTVDEMIGHTECLKQRRGDTRRSATLDYTYLLDQSFATHPHSHFNPDALYDFHLDHTTDMKVLMKSFKGALKTGKHKEISLTISSTDRAFGTIFGSEVTKRWHQSLPDDTFVIKAYGGAGQSLGAFLPQGVTIQLTGDANDGVGKGLSGGKIIITPPSERGFTASDNIIVGNVALYGATAGTCYCEGIAGERFCVRNSGATAVVEGCGDHGLEYMTGGKVVVLGETGKNFAAGMSGGIAYVLDRHHSLYKKVNKDMVKMVEVTEKFDQQELKQLLIDYVQATGSKLGQTILNAYEDYLPYFKKIVPVEYARILHLISTFEEKGMSHERSELEAFNVLEREATHG
ncbi:MAG: glutamate synthase large subunit [Erysipelotrichaceae bacterium]|nr:glutamate synthase large subunit [Erysipelotrichaceae bacterium]